MQVHLHSQLVILQEVMQQSQAIIDLGLNGNQSGKKIQLSDQQ